MYSDQWKSVRRIAAAECSSFVCLCNSPQTVTLSTAAGLNLADRPAGFVSYRRLPTKYAADPQFVANILCTPHTVCCCVLSYCPCMVGWIRPPSLQDINTNFPFLSVWASQEISCFGQFPFVTNLQMECAVCFCLIIYQISRKMCVFINHKICSPCTAAHQILYSALSTDILWTADGRGGPIDWPARSSGNNALCLWLLEYIKLLCNHVHVDNWLQVVRQVE